MSLASVFVMSVKFLSQIIKSGGVHATICPCMAETKVGKDEELIATRMRPKPGEEEERGFHTTRAVDAVQSIGAIEALHRDVDIHRQICSQVRCIMRAAERSRRVAITCKAIRARS